MSGITGVDGLASGIQTTEIVDAMISAARNSTRVQENRMQFLEARLEAVRGFNTRLLSAQLDLTNLRSGSAFGAMTATPSNASVLSASANSTAVQGNYSFQVTQLAQAHQVATKAQASRGADLGAGTLTLQLGSGSPVELNLDADSSSLDDVAAAINAAGAGVSAYVVEQTGAEPFRLIMQSAETGLASEISLTGTGGMESLFNDPIAQTLDTITEAQDAELSMGSGAGALTFSSATNAFSQVIPGVTINAQSLGSSSLSVGRDVSGASSAISTFVESLNGAIDYLNANTEVDPEGENTGILLSETDLRRSLDGVIRELFSAVPGLPQSLNNVTSIGMGLDRNTGRVTLDEAALNARLASDPNGVAKLFNNSGTSSNPGVQFASISSDTNAESPFAIEITQAAEQATTTGADVAAGVTIDNSNKAFSLAVNGRSYAMNLAEGTYTRDQLVSHLQTVLNEQVSNQDQVVVGLNGDQLTLSTSRYGSSSTIDVGSSSANAVLGFATGLRSGQDVAGTINGQAATGTGQILTGNEGDGKGLSLIVTANAPVASATVNVSVGLGQRLGSRFSLLTDNQNGSITQKENSLTSSITNIDEQIKKVDARLEVRREGLLREFRTMETLIGQLQSQQSFLAGAIDSWSNLSRNVSGGN